MRTTSVVNAVPTVKSNSVKSNNDFRHAYPKAGGSNATFQFPPARPYRGVRRQTSKPDLIATLNG